MQFARQCCNAVLLPNGDVFAVGGADFDQFINPVLDTEIFNKVTKWKQDAALASPRSYHSVAVLLRSGRVWVGGGDMRTWDHEVYTPPYLANGQMRPAFAGQWADPTLFTQLQWNTVHQIPLALTPVGSPPPVGVTVARAVLMRPCSVTHHSDMDQRYVELQRIDSTDDSIVVRTPPQPTNGTAVGSARMPPGWYLMFLVSSEDTPSVGKWVRFQ